MNSASIPLVANANMESIVCVLDPGASVDDRVQVSSELDGAPPTDSRTFAAVLYGSDVIRLSDGVAYRIIDQTSSNSIDTSSLLSTNFQVNETDFFRKDF